MKNQIEQIKQLLSQIEAQASSSEKADLLSVEKELILLLDRVDEVCNTVSGYIPSEEPFKK